MYAKKRKKVYAFYDIENTILKHVEVETLSKRNNLSCRLFLQFVKIELKLIGNMPLSEGDNGQPKSYTNILIYSW